MAATAISLLCFAIFAKFAALVVVEPKDFDCGAVGEVIPFDWRCDGMDDCTTGKDEIDCDSIARCGAHEWQCEDGTCIEDSMKCNSHEDCADGSDEGGSLCGTYAPYCPMNTMKCGKGPECISITKRCDGHRDCPNAYDELFCGSSLSCDPVDEFTCKQGECINKQWVCDRKTDCQDGSDEDVAMCAAMTTTFRPGPTVRPLPSEFCADGLHHKCENGLCINSTFVCDGTPHCPDGTDESGECENACLGNGGCGHNCQPTPKGPRCYCRHGYLLQKNTKICRDINECNEIPPLCSQHCVNTPGSYECSCDNGYALEPNGHHCRLKEGRPDILYVEGSKIKHLLYTAHAKHSGVMASDAVGLITAFDYDARTGNIYWASSKYGAVYVNGPTGNKTIIHGIGHCDGLAVDWSGRNIYYIDTDRKIINVCGMNASHTGECFTAVQNLEDRPKSLVLDPTVGRMFWCDDGQSPRIERAYMTGRQRSAIVASYLARPTALTLDLTQRRVYWVDSHLRHVESCDYSGHFRIKVLESPALHAYGLNIFEDLLYWSTSEGIFQAHKHYTNSSKDINKLITLDQRPGMVKAMHKLAQPNATDHCSRKNPTCSHLCLLTPMGAECRCPNFMQAESSQPYNCMGVDCQNGGVPIIIDMNRNEVQCRYCYRHQIFREPHCTGCFYSAQRITNSMD